MEVSAHGIIKVQRIGYAKKLNPMTGDSEVKMNI